MAENVRNQTAPELIKSLESLIRNTLDDDLKAIRDSIKTVETNLAQKLDALGKEQSKANDTIKRELTSRIDEIAQSLSSVPKDQAQAIKAAETRINSSLAQINERTSKESTQMSVTVETVRQDVSNQLAFAQAQIDQEIVDLRTAVDGTTAQLQTHAAEIKRVGSLMSGFARIFNDPGAFAASAGSVDPSGPVKLDMAQSGQVSKAPAKKQGSAPAKGGAEGDPGLPSSDDIGEHMDNLFK